MKKLIILLISLFIVKLDASMINTTNTSGINGALTYTFNTFERPSLYLYYTNKFNCNSNGCTSSNFENIGIISIYEYETYKGKYSYLSGMNSYFGLDNDVIKNINNGLIESITNETISGVRPTVYVKKGVRVTGNGTPDDPWIFTSDYDFTLTFNPNGGEVNPKSKEITFSEPYGDLPTPIKTGYTFKGWYLEDTFKTKIDKDSIVEKYGDSVAYAKWEINTYLVKVVVENGYTGNPSQTINYNENATFDINPNTSYQIEGSIVTCSSGTKYNLSGDLLTISNVDKEIICTVSLSPSYYCADGTITNDSSKGYICVKSSSLVKGSSYSCNPYTYSYKCGCQSCYSWCNQFTGENKESCVDACGSVAPEVNGNCSYGDIYCTGTGYETCYNPDYYACSSGWSDYTGSGSALTCYKAAFQYN